MWRKCQQFRGLQFSSGTVGGSTITALFSVQPARAAFSLLNLGTFPTYLILQSTPCVRLRMGRSCVFQVPRKACNRIRLSTSVISLFQLENARSAVGTHVCTYMGANGSQEKGCGTTMSKGKVWGKILKRKVQQGSGLKWDVRKDRARQYKNQDRKGERKKTKEEEDIWKRTKKREKVWVEKKWKEGRKGEGKVSSTIFRKTEILKHK